MKKFSKITEILTLVTLTALVITLPTFFLWNWLMPEIFGLPKLSFWEALGVSALSSLLFKTNDNGK